MREEKYSEEDFLEILYLAVYFGFFGVHRLYLKRFLSGVLFILGTIFFVLGMFFCIFLNLKGVIVLFFITFWAVNYFRWIIDIILIVSGRFKDRENKIISNVLKKDSIYEKFIPVSSYYEIRKQKFCKYAARKSKKLKEKEDILDISEKDVVILYFLTGAYHGVSRSILGFLGIYKFYAGKYFLGFLNVILMFVNALLLILFAVYRELFRELFFVFIWFIMIYAFLTYLSIFYDIFKILGGKYKDRFGKVICLNHFKEYNKGDLNEI